jgi:DDE superfamily endonuclease/Helix-turn-helix of DDE superfamily endonuclease
MSHSDRLKRTPDTFRRLTGLSPGAFDRLLAQLAPRYHEADARRKARPDRRRKPGAGRKHALTLCDRLLMLLIYYRTYVSHAFLGFLFGLDDSSVGRNINPLQPLLAGVFRIPERRIELQPDEVRELFFQAGKPDWSASAAKQARGGEHPATSDFPSRRRWPPARFAGLVFFDATERPTRRPAKKQRRYYSGKKKRHTLKNQVVVARKRKRPGRRKAGRPQRRRLRVAAVSPTAPGKVHDKKVYDQTRAMAPPGAAGYGDTGYQGTGLRTPVKKRPKRQLTRRQRRGNRRLSRKRIAAEHGIGKMKIWRIAAERYRNPIRRHTLIMKNVAGLHNLMFS